jgi:hypothetical protein
MGGSFGVGSARKGARVIDQAIAKTLMVARCLLLGASPRNTDAQGDGRSNALLSPSDRVSAFEKIWKIISEDFYDSAYNGADWNGAHARYRPLIEAASSDVEFYDLLDEMLALLRDYTPRFTARRHIRAGRSTARTSESPSRSVTAGWSPPASTRCPRPPGRASRPACSSSQSTVRPPASDRRLLPAGGHVHGIDHLEGR